MKTSKNTLMINTLHFAQITRIWIFNDNGN